jgi:hypothetical protein
MTTYPVSTDFTILQGATLNLPLTAIGSDGNAIDWTGYKARMQARVGADSGVVLFALTTENSSVTVAGTPTDQGVPGIVVNATQVVLHMSAATTALLSFDTVAYDIEMYFEPLDSSPEYVCRAFQGTVTLNLNVTR